MTARRFSLRPAASRACHAALLGSAALSLSGCVMVGPDYHRPAAIVSPRFKELRPQPGWSYAEPERAEANKGEWWKVFNDPLLDGMEAQVALNNQNVKDYEAQYRYARAMVDSIRGQLYPTLSGTFQFNRNAIGNASRNVSGGSFVNYGTDTSHTVTTYTNTWQTGPSASWDLDLWGRIRRQIQSQVASAQASAAQLANAQLSYQSSLASDYFSLRYQDSLKHLYEYNAKLFGQALQILRNQQAAGVVDPTSVLQEEYQYQQARADAIQAGVARAQYEHAIAVLMGKPPASLSIPEGRLPDALPAIPPIIPSVLLERRPDVAQAERNMESTNASVGAAIAAFYPQVSLSASYLYSGDPLGMLIQTAGRTWALGAASTETFFQGGQRTAAVREAEAQYDEAVATYRQTVLSAIQGTEDQLSNLRILSEQLERQQLAVRAATQAVGVSMNEYLAGTQIYTTVIQNQQTALQTQVTALQIQESRLTSSVSLIVALGGGWNVQDLPTKGSLQRNQPLLPSAISPDK